MMLQKALIQEKQYSGERPLFARKNLRIERSSFNPGESPLKHGEDIEAVHCQFSAKYPFWHGDRIDIEDSVFHVRNLVIREHMYGQLDHRTGSICALR